MQKRTEFDSTMLGLFCTCERKYDLRINRGLVGKKPPIAADFGKAIHLGLDEWYKTRNVDVSVDTFKQNFTESEDDSKRTYEIGEWILRNYDTCYKDQPWNMLASEQEFTLKMPYGNNYVGRIDKIVDWNGTLWVVDHKTTSQLGSTYMNMAEPNSQFTGYVWAAREMGFPVVGIIVDAILVAKGLLDASRRAKLTPLLRFDSYRSDEMIIEWLDTVQVIQDTIDLHERIDLWMPTGQYNTACTYYGECPYRKVCKEDEELRERLLETEYEVDFWDPREKEKKDAGTY